MPRQDDPTGEVVDILGLESPTNGRSSEDHEVNGAVIEVGSVVQFKRVKVTIEDMEEWAIGVYAVTTEEGDGLLVAFLGRFLVKRWQRYEGRFAVVKEMYRYSDSSSLRAKSHRSCGAASTEIITGHAAGAAIQKQSSDAIASKNKRKKKRRRTIK